MAFHFKNGTSAENLEDLTTIIPELSDEEFSSYVSFEHNNFADWIEGTLSQPELANNLRGKTNRDDIVQTIKDFLGHDRLPKEPLFPHEAIKDALKQDEHAVASEVEPEPTMAPVKPAVSEPVVEETKPVVKEEPKESHKIVHEEKHVTHLFHDVKKLVIKEFMYGILIGLVVGVIIGVLITWT